ncbi:hypothetical protein EHQ81_19490 [Leptospira selangorensis]|uniref:Lipoprotein n=1 Tax=Leptospira selangorensis TaxID=2484982 RepID=A0A5F2C9N4_9LEPT|nr:hypothetical protein [Leptospira selangorensis]TGM10290.1 hypothetical protein EHQ81_19490 [Leptospira selangorensis]TGM27952.1 hypothetical protein EHQ82_01670 [Leptospira selangorensis]
MIRTQALRRICIISCFLGLSCAGYNIRELDDSFANKKFRILSETFSCGEHGMFGGKFEAIKVISSSEIIFQYRASVSTHSAIYLSGSDRPVQIKLDETIYLPAQQDFNNEYSSSWFTEFASFRLVLKDAKPAVLYPDDKMLIKSISEAKSFQLKFTGKKGYVNCTLSLENINNFNRFYKEEVLGEKPLQ